MLISSFTTANGSFELKPRKSLSIKEPQKKKEKQNFKANPPQIQSQKDTSSNPPNPPSSHEQKREREREAKQKAFNYSKKKTEREFRDVNVCVYRTCFNEILTVNFIFIFVCVYVVKEHIYIFISRWLSYRYIRS